MAQADLRKRQFKLLRKFAQRGEIGSFAVCASSSDKALSSSGSTSGPLSLLAIGNSMFDLDRGSLVHAARQSSTWNADFPQL